MSTKYPICVERHPRHSHEESQRAALKSMRRRLQMEIDGTSQKSKTGKRRADALTAKLVKCDSELAATDADDEEKDGD